MPNLTHKLLYAVHQHYLIPPDSKLVVAVSGGADSMALLHLLYTLQDRLACHLHVATLDHGLRGEAGTADAEFVRQTAESWGLSVTVGKAELDPNAPGIEARAREARYNFLAKTAYSIGADRIATAHHADDQAETVLMHLIRGGGIHGLSGMAYHSQLLSLIPHPSTLNPDGSILSPQPLTLIRPMLDITREEIEAYCMAHQLAYRHDATNDQPTTLRNRLRLETLPHLRELNGQIVPALNRLAEIARAEDDYLAREAAQFIAEHGVRETVECIALHRDAFRALHIALQRRVIQQVGQYEVPPDFAHIEASVRLMQTWTTQVGAVAQMPGGWQVRMGYNVIYVEKVDTPESYAGYLLPKGFEQEINIPETLITPYGWRLMVQPSIEEATPSYDSIMLTLPLNASVMLRTRRRGDRLAPNGLEGHTRKLKDWMIDRKMPQRLRDQIPLLTVNDEIAAVLWESEWRITEPFIFRQNATALHNTYIHVTVAKI